MSKRLFKEPAAQQSSSAKSSPPIKKYQTQCPANRNEKMYLDPESADVHFSFGSADLNPSSARIPAHKDFLAADSDVFKATFHGGSQGECVGDINELDASDAVFKDFLKFFYLSEVELHAENVAGLMHLGYKYNVTRCIDVCVKYLKDAATADNILLALGLAILHNHSQLKQFCGRFIMLNTDAVLKSNDFLKCERQTLAHIINENLLACSDVKVFEACMEWVKAKSKQNVLTKKIVDTHLGDLFYEIRFGSMAIREFCNLATKYDAVLSNDFKTITKLITLPNFQPEKFNIRPRRIKIDDMGIEKIICNRVVPSNRQSGNGGFDMIRVDHEEETIFSTNKPLHLAGLTFVNGEDSDSDDDEEEDDDNESLHYGKGNSIDNNDDDPSNWKMSIKVQIAEISGLYSYSDAKGKILMSTNVKVSSHPVGVPLPWPVLVKPGLRYQILISPCPDSFTYAPKQLDDSVYLRSKATTIEFYNCSDAFNDHSERNETVGLISTLEFIDIRDK